LKFAAVDIGSNAARLQISAVLRHPEKGIHFKKVEYVRFPLRLGIDVFKMQTISPQREANILKLLHSYKLLMELHEVDDYMVLATSAMREAANGAAIVKRVKEELGLEMQIISGDEESTYVNKALWRSLDDKNYLHIDVGGGSTEVTLYSEKQMLASRSFEIGSIRLLEDTVSPAVWQDMQDWVETNVRNRLPKLLAVGIGGNINKVASMAKNKEKVRSITTKDIEFIQAQIAAKSFEERINELDLNPDRADVILLASNIYLSVMKWAKIKEILIPGLGLKDGIIELLVEKHGLE
jgi:exopolyphosphatase/guanosine-5'-triphosphate,3'-diphosphate pyrophosphatase